MQLDLARVISQFQLEGSLLDVAPCGNGHINDTFASRFQTSSGIVRYVHQRINHHIFREPEKLMENVERVTRYARARIIAAGGNPARETLNLVHSTDGKTFYRSPAGDYWRTYLFIEGARTYDQIVDLRHVYSAANAFGRFQRMLSDLPGTRLHETIIDFHHTRKRFEAFTSSLDLDVKNRARLAKPEIELALARDADTNVVINLLATGQLPERVTHNDTKLNNVMIDDATGEGICVIDLDTVMPGSTLYDFGDLVRVSASTAAEDECDLAKVSLDLGMFERLAHGYLDATRDWLSATEFEYLAFAGKLITLEQAIRFLADYLNGDIYYKIHRPDHNLDRCRTQFKLVVEMEQMMDQLKAIVARYSKVQA
jgi:hypothetical protein